MDALKQLEYEIYLQSIGQGLNLGEEFLPVIKSVVAELRAAREWVKENWHDDVSGRIAQSLDAKMKEARGE